tara:strand:- start:51 stop:407 length:357 start_codon:yes stop_codon:yes gene_type:complete
MGFLGKMLHKRLKKKLGLTKMQKTIDAIPAKISSGDAKIIKAIEGLGEGGLGEEQTNFSQEEGITNTVDPTMSGPDIGGVLNPPPTFDPNTKAAAAGMFGDTMDGSFDRSLDTEEEIV